MKLIVAFALLTALVAIVTFVASDMYAEEIGDLYAYINHQIEKAK